MTLLCFGLGVGWILSFHFFIRAQDVPIFNCSGFLLFLFSDQSNDPFWPALHCFMVILDKLGSKVWGQPIDPVEAFQNIINNPSYRKEIRSIRDSCKGSVRGPLFFPVSK